MRVNLDFNLEELSFDEVSELLEELEEEYASNMVIVEDGKNLSKYIYQELYMKNASIRSFALRILGFKDVDKFTINQDASLKYFIENIDRLTEDKLKSL